MAQSYTPAPKDKLFLAAARKLGALTDDQLRECVKVVFERRGLGLEKDLADAALDKGFVTPETLRPVLALVQRALAKRAGSISSKPEMDPVGAAAGETVSEPDLIDGYAIVDKLGEGAMATVFRARHRVLDKEVALKILAPEYSENGEYVSRFIREARAAARIDHPNVVHIHDAGESRGRHFIAMELVEGVTLEQLVERDGPLSEIAALEAALGVARALEAAAAEKIVHRDVKPANIARTPDGRIKLLDLGLARVQHRRGDDGYITDHGRTLGTPSFVSPEQARGEDLDSRSDIYSLGVTLFFLVAGECPFKGTTAAEVMRRHIEDPVPPVRVLRPSLSAEIDLLLQKMLAKDPKRRYQTPRELAEALELLISGEASAAAEPARGERAERGARRARKETARAAREKAQAAEKRPRPAPLAQPGSLAASRSAAAAAAAAAPPSEPRSTVAVLGRACAALGALLVVLVAIKWSLGPAVRASASARERGREPEAAGAARAAAEDEKERLPGDFFIAKRRADELASGGDPQGALALWRSVFPAERRTGAARDAVEREERAIRDSVAKRLEQDFENAEQRRKEGHFRIAQRIYERVKLYGGPAELARAEAELRRLDAEEAAARAAGRVVEVGAHDQEAFGRLLAEVAPLVREGRYEEAAARARAAAGSLEGSRHRAAAEEAARLLAELHLLDGAVEATLAQLAGESIEIRLASGEVVAGRVGAVGPGGAVTIAGEKGPANFKIAGIAPADKERLALYSRGRTSDLERLLVIHELYRGEVAEARIRAERLGTPALLEHVRLVSESAPAAKPLPEPEPPPAGKAEPPPAGKAEPPPAAGSRFERVLTGFLKAPVRCGSDGAFEADYTFLSGTEETLKDWTVVRPAFRSGFTAKGYQLECGSKHVAKLVYKVPLAQPYDLDLTVHFEEKSASTNFILTFGEGKGGTGYGVDCGQVLFRRSRGEIVQVLKRAPNPAASYLKAWADVPVKLSIADDEATCLVEGKTTIEKVKVKGASGTIGFEVNDGRVAVKNLRIRAQPDPTWLLDELRKIKE